MEIIQGYSKLSANDKLDVLCQAGIIDQSDFSSIINFRHQDQVIQSLFEKFTENVVSSYHLPYSIAPNFLINNEIIHIPMVIEESSVVAAASWSARFWSDKGGFRTRVISENKIGQILFKYAGGFSPIQAHQESLNEALRKSAADLTQNMEKRGGGISKFEWLEFGEKVPGVYQCRVSFITADSMGANFINSCLEQMGKELIIQLHTISPEIPESEVIMAILSNYTPECLVECTLENDVSDFSKIKGVDEANRFAEKFLLAVDIANNDPYRAVTHNKGIFNGMDAVVMATANDFRAFEAGGHAFASKDGEYKSLSTCKLENGIFTYTLRVPVSVGTVGGLTSTHPLAKLSLKILGNPSASKLMQIIAAAGMANNFAAIKALITSGIQEGHMKMHLSKILIQLGADNYQTEQANKYFSDKTVSHKDVQVYINKIKKKQL